MNGCTDKGTILQATKISTLSEPPVNFFHKKTYTCKKGQILILINILVVLHHQQKE